MPDCGVCTNSGHLNVEDHDRLLSFLVQKGELNRDEHPICRNLVGGVSNRTVQVIRASLPNLIVKQALAKLRVEADWFSSPERIHREYAALGVFAALLPGKVPRVHFEDNHHHIVVMEQVPEPHINWKEQMLDGSVEIGHWSSFGEMLAQVHMATHNCLSDLPTDLQDKSFFETLRLEPYYEYSGQQVPGTATFMGDLIAETRSLSISLVHGDYSPKNVLIHDNALYLLDYEVCHIGDPAFDVGFGLTHALSKAHKLPGLRQELLRGSSCFWQTYSGKGALQILGSDLEQRAVRHTLACLLARVVGRSPLEYLSRDQRFWQVEAVIEMMQRDFVTIPELIAGFRHHLEDAGRDSSATD